MNKIDVNKSYALLTLAAGKAECSNGRSQCALLHYMSQYAHA